MPVAGNCRYPAHHDGPSGGPPVTLLLAILAGAGIVAYARTVLVVLAVVAVLAIIAGAVMLLVHSSHSAPYDAAWSEPERQEAPRQLPAGQSAPVVTQVVHVHPAAAPDRTEALTAEVAALRAELAAQQSAAAIVPPAQHLHLYGVSPADVAELVARPSSRPALEEKS